MILTDIVSAEAEDSDEVMEQYEGNGVNIDLTDYDKEIHYWENISCEYEEYMGDISQQLKDYLKRDIQFQSQIDTFIEKQDYMCVMWEKAKETLKGAEQAKEKYIDLYKK